MPNSLPQLSVDLKNHAPSHGDNLVAMQTQGDSVVAIPFSFATADGAVLFTCPSLPGSPRFRIAKAYYEIATGFTGGASSAIGLKSSNSKYNTAGDLLGGASGDVAATLVAGFANGTIGTKVNTQPVVLNAGDTIIFDRITSAFTAGVGLIHIEIQVLPSS